MKFHLRPKTLDDIVFIKQFFCFVLFCLSAMTNIPFTQGKSLRDCMVLPSSNQPASSSALCKAWRDGVSVMERSGGIQKQGLSDPYLVRYFY